MESELNIGHKIQMGMLTTDFPKMDEIEVNAILKPAREVGGDLYDVFFIDENHLCCCVGDVSGKGVPAALFMAISKTLLKAITTHHCASTTEGSTDHGEAIKYSSATIMNIVNDELCRDNEQSMFVTAFLCILNVNTGKVVYTNAGHNPPYVISARNQLRIVDDRHGVVLGAMEGFEYNEDEMQLEHGELLLIYTDGVTEAFNESDELFTDARLKGLLSGLEIVNVQTAVSAVIKGVEDFEGETEQTDDITVLAVQRK